MHTCARHRDFADVLLLQRRRRKRLRPLIPVGVEIVEVESQYLDDAGSDLVIRHRRLGLEPHSPLPRHDQHGVEVVLVVAAMLGNLRSACEDYAPVDLRKNVGKVVYFNDIRPPLNGMRSSAEYQYVAVHGASRTDRRPDRFLLGGRLNRAVQEGHMPSDYAIVLLAGVDPDLLLLRSAVLAAAGVWSLRVRNAEQAIQVLGLVPCDLAIICYTLDDADQQRLVSVLQSRYRGVRFLHVASGDDCSGTGFLRKVEEALGTPAPRDVVIACRRRSACQCTQWLLRTARI